VIWQGCTDCGLYAIAFAVDLAMGCTLSTVKYRQAEMRSHLKKCLQEGTFTRFPHDKRTCHAGRPETVTVILLKQEAKNFSKKQKGFRDGLSYSVPQKSEETREMPFPSIGPITLKKC